MAKKTLISSFVIIVLLFLAMIFGVWAQGIINLPQTGQTECYDSFGTEISCTGTGQDGELQTGVEWPDPRFTVSGNCVTDNLTGLMWAKNGNLLNGTRTWQGALDFVASINSGAGLCGYKDWRLPNVNELESLVNAAEPSTVIWLTNQGFSNVQPHYYWSSTTLVNDNSLAWIVSIRHGFVYERSKSYSYYIWPVRSGQLDTPDNQFPANISKTGQTISYAIGDDGDLERGVAWPVQRFTDHGDGTATDNLTGLMWTIDANMSGQKTWQEALDYVKTLGTGGHSDWRLPNKKELLSLIDRSRFIPALPAGHPFQNVNVQSSNYWSSTTNADSTDDAWIINMWGGYVSYVNKSYGLFVWPVRSEQGAFGYSDISVNPNPVPFGDVNVGDTSDQTITVKNDGNANLVIGTITDPALPFSKVVDNCSGKSISPSGTCTVTYQFSPTSASNFLGNSNIPSNDPDENPKTVGLTGTGVTVQGGLSVTPVENFNSAGFEGGPFSPLAKDYTLTNTGTTPISWGAAKTKAWVILSKSSGTLIPNASITLNVSILPNRAQLLNAGAFEDIITFTNKTNHNGDTTRKVNLLVDAINLNLVSPAIGEKFTVCTYYLGLGPPTFQWEVNGGTLKGLELRFYNDDDPPIKVTVNATAAELTQKGLQIKTSAWKDILNLPGTDGGKVNWRAVGTKQNDKKVKSEIRSFEVSAPEAVGNPKISHTSISQQPPPTLSWNNNCNSKFKVWFYNDPAYYDKPSTLGVKKTSLSFTDTDPTGDSGGFTKELTSSQWTSIQNVVGKTSGSKIYWHVKSSDVVSTERIARTDMQEFTLKD